MRFTVNAPLKGFTGNVVGIDFVDGAGEFDTSNDAGRAAQAYFERAGYRMDRVADEEPDEPKTPAVDEPFDPSEHSVDDVMAYLETADLREAERVIQAESDGKARKGILHPGGPLLASKEGENQ